MEGITSDALLLFMFTIPGFFIVWTYKCALKEKIESDFEYLMFSVFWGVALLAVFGQITSKEDFDTFFVNIFASMFALSLFGTLLSWIFAQTVINERYPDRWNIYVLIEQLILRATDLLKERYYRIFENLIRWVKKEK